MIYWPTLNQHLTESSDWYVDQELFLKSPCDFLAVTASLKIKTSYLVAWFLAHKPVNFVSFANSFIWSFSNLLKPFKSQ